MAYANARQFLVSKNFLKHKSFSHVRLSIGNISLLPGNDCSFIIQVIISSLNFKPFTVTSQLVSICPSRIASAIPGYDEHTYDERAYHLNTHNVSTLQVRASDIHEYQSIMNLKTDMMGSNIHECVKLYLKCQYCDSCIGLMISTT